MRHSRTCMPSSASFVRSHSSSASSEIGSPRVTVSGPQTATKPCASAKASVRSASARCAGELRAASPL